MLDSDLAIPYGVNEQARINPNHYPEAFMFQLTHNEFDSLKSQFATSKEGRRGQRKHYSWPLKDVYNYN